MQIYGPGSLYDTLSVSPISNQFISWSTLRWLGGTVLRLELEIISVHFELLQYSSTASQSPISMDIYLNSLPSVLEQKPNLEHGSGKRGEELGVHTAKL
jgi:hypothetical protein